MKEEPMSKEERARLLEELAVRAAELKEDVQAMITKRTTRAREYERAYITSNNN